MTKNLDFDELQIEHSQIDRIRKLVWFKNKKVIKKRDITDEDLMNIKCKPCSACLMLRGELIEMSLRKKFTLIKDKKGNLNLGGEGKRGEYVFNQCPSCFGLDAGNCTCHEKPHRIGCPMGFYLYFQNSIV